MATFTVNTHHAYLNNDIVIKSDGTISVEDIVTQEKYLCANELRTRLCAGKHILKSEDHVEEIYIEDAIKLGGSRIKNAFVFDDNPWLFVSTKDRLYIANRKTNEERTEYNVTPDSICELEYYGMSCEFFLFQTKQDYAIYNAQQGKIVFKFTNYIFSNGHLVIYRTDEGIVAYDYRQNRAITQFNGQYSFGSKFYFVKDNKLYGLNIKTLYINVIDSVGEIGSSDVLLNNNLIKLEKDYVYKKIYTYFDLGNGENIKAKTDLLFPYYIENWMGMETVSFKNARDMYNKFKEDNRRILSDYPYITNLCMGIRICRISYHWEKGKHVMSLFGEIISYPAIGFIVPFKLEGIEGESLDFSNIVIEQSLVSNRVESEKEEATLCYELSDDERLIGKSSSGNCFITTKDKKLFMRNIKDNSRNEIFCQSFDTSSYINAYFTSDGKNVVIQINDKEGQILGFEDLEMTRFEVDGFTVARNEGVNGYKPEIIISDGRKPVWRDPITLDIVSDKDMSKHIYLSPDGSYSANINMKTILYNRLTKSEITIEERIRLNKIYNWNSSTPETEKKRIIELRKQLAEQSERDALFGKLIESINKTIISLSRNSDEKSTEKRKEKAIEDSIKGWINNHDNFTELFIDRLSFVCYQKNQVGQETKQILIGRNVYYLNYVSFSYDSKYLSFAAKMKQDEFRYSEEGVFEIYDLKKEEILTRIEDYQNRQLWAVWMTMFSKKGDVAFYDSHANAYLMSSSNNYTSIEEAPGKSLLCFSPSGKYVACSDQNYIDFAHHPISQWGHQPSGNVFIHTADNFTESIEQYNDFGDGIEGVAFLAGNVSSAAFSQDEKKLLAVGNDGVVVIRNLKKTSTSGFCLNPNEEDRDFLDDDYGTHYGEFAGSYAQDVMHISDDVINDAFEGDPDAYWNID